MGTLSPKLLEILRKWYPGREPAICGAGVYFSHCYSWAIPCAGRDVYYIRHRSEWLGKTAPARLKPAIGPRSSRNMPKGLCESRTFGQLVIDTSDLAGTQEIGAIVGGT